MSRASGRVSPSQSGIPMANRLLDRQISLLEYLSSAAAIFGDQTDAPVDPALQEIDGGVLRLLARFACNKRLEKIVAVFPRTLEILGADQRSVLREFVEASRPTNKSTLTNAREFHEFLSARWRCEPPKPAYLPDVAACEIAMAEVRKVVEAHERPAKNGKGDGPARAIRHRRSVAPLRCAHDIRSIFDAGSGAIVPSKRDTSLVVILPAGFRDVRIVEVAPVVVDALTLLDDWADPSALDGFGDRKSLVSHLAAHDYIEVRA
jgi:hypothetical protein